MKSKFQYLPVLVFVSIAVLLSFVQVKVDNPLILLERFVEGGGWIEIFLLSLYGAFLAFKMQNPSEQAKWRLRSWSLFSLVFFTQLILGLLGFEDFLMTGKLHLPVPMMIVAGPVFRLELSFMPILFISTIILSGPAWCSQLCYFGAIDGMLASSKGKGMNFFSKGKLDRIKLSGIFIVIATAMLLRLFQVPVLYTTILAALFGILGILLMLILSRRTGKMVNCIAWCPVGTLVNYLKYTNPFRFRIADTCTLCMRCVPVCRYRALSKENIEKGLPGSTCTLCGDCLSVCKPNAFYYKFPGLGPARSRKLYLGITIVLHAAFLGLARM